MKKTLVLLLFSLMALSACKSKAPQITEEITPKLHLVWETDSTMTTCESVLYDNSSKVIYVANINHKPWETDHNGFISTIDSKGKIIDKYWLSQGLSGPKGMGIFNGKLYINDINQMVEVDIKSQKITNTYPIDGESALNDITIDDKGLVFSSNSATGEIYKLQNGKFSPFVQLVDTGRLNGLLVDEEGLFFTYSKQSQLGFYNFESQTTAILNDSIGWGDGIIRLCNGDLITSSWDGKLYYISSRNYKSTLLLNTSAQKINAADIDYIPEEQLLIVPTFFHNTVRAYKVTFK